MSPSALGKAPQNYQMSTFRLSALATFTPLSPTRKNLVFRGKKGAEILAYVPLFSYLCIVFQRWEAHYA